MGSLLLALRTFVRRECGVTAIEYALLASLIAVSMTVGIALAGANLDALFNSVAATVADPAASAAAGGNGKGGNGNGNGSGNGNAGGKGNGGPGSGVGGGNGG
jgi:Flp pilus assembly pilin Flp